MQYMKFVKKLLQLKCAWYMLYWKQSWSNQQLQCFPQKCEMEKYSQLGREYWSYGISGRVCKPQEQNSCYLSRSKTSCTSSICSWTCTPKGHPEQWHVVYGRTSAIGSPATPLPVGQAGLSSQQAGGWHQPIAQLPPSTVIREKDLSTGAMFTGTPETSHPSREGFPDPTLQQRKQGCCGEQTWGRQKPIHLRYTAEHSNYSRGVQHACLFAALHHTPYNSLQESILPLIQS